MRPLATVLVFAAALAALPQLPEMGALSGGAITLILGLVAGCVASEVSAISIALGALGALVWAYLAPNAPELAGAMFVAFAYGARALRAPTLVTKGGHVIASLAAGAIGAHILLRYENAEVGVVAAAALIAGILAAIPMAITTDDPMTWSLAGLAWESQEPTRSSLLRAVSIRRKLDEETLQGLNARVTQQLSDAWKALLETARSRASSRSGAVQLLDKRIGRYVDALERIYTAAEERAARSAGLDDHALEAAKAEGDRLEAEIAALVEVSGPIRVESSSSETKVAPVVEATTDAAVEAAASKTEEQPVVPPTHNTPLFH